MLQTQLNSFHNLLQQLLNHRLLNHRQPSSQPRRWFSLVLSLILFAACTGCTSGLGGSWVSSPALEFRINQVEASNRADVYSVTGQTTLPNKTQITVSAVRYLQDGSGSFAEQAGYTILDRQFAQVNQGTWRTSLNLGQPASQNQLQEGQIRNGSGTQLAPNPKVIFLATLDPTQQSGSLRNQIEQLDPSQQIAMSRFTSDGELYLQASQALTVPLPSGQPFVMPASKPPVEVTAEDLPSTDWKQTSLPLSSDSFLR